MRATSGVVHLVGIGGIGVSGLARILLAHGYAVTGSDLKRNEQTDELEAMGVGMHVGHSPDHLPDGCSLVVRSAAIPDDNVEIAAARERGIEVVKYAQMLGRLMGAKIGIAVSGSHGKTSTTAMVAYILARAGFEPTFVCGGVIPQLGSNAAPGKGKHFVAEACEYDRSFHQLRPQCAVITNIEEDHLDYYKDIQEIAAAFEQFAGKVGEKGLVVGSLDNPHSAAIVERCKGHGEGTSIAKDADWRARNVSVVDGQWRFEALKYGRPFGEFTLKVPGIHNVSNALAAMAVATWSGVGREIIQLALSEFSGAARRFQVLGEGNGAVVIDDYGHHPTEIQATLRAARERYPDKRIWCVFQPHQHSRTRMLLKEFGRSFGDANLVLLPEIYAARDSQKDIKGISSADLAKLVNENGTAALYLPTFDDVVRFLAEKIEPGTIVLTMGAGDVYEVGRRFLERKASGTE
ncbi:MAG: UDP-N-acetylmuramate--L-alanine ligase [Planctomycetes bacterium]|nr:UDP-N-acetylmuramate--L-alanine ligase [Planctomycetota bacterium]